MPDMRNCPPPEIDDLIRAQLESQTPSDFGIYEDAVDPTDVTARVHEKLEAPATEAEVTAEATLPAQGAPAKKLPQTTELETAALETEQLGMYPALFAYAMT